MSKLIFKIAKRNNKYSNDVYKTLMQKLNISKRTPIKTFKEAFHSSKTAPEIRTMALATLYEGKKNIMQEFVAAFRGISPKQMGSARKVWMTVDKSKGVLRLRLNTFSEEKTALRELRLSSAMKREIQAWEPMGNKSPLLTKALQQGNAHALKAAYVVEELKKPFVALAHMIYNNIRYNDPTWWYFDYNDAEFISKTENAGAANTHKDNEAIFKNDLEYMRLEINKFMPIMERLGVNTFNFFEQFDGLMQRTTAFLNKDFKLTKDEIRELHNIHIAGEDILPTILKITNALETTDLTQKIESVVGKYEIMPSFTHPRPHALVNQTVKIREETASNVVSHIFKSITSQDKGRKKFMENRWTKTFFKDEEPDYEP